MTPDTMLWLLAVGVPALLGVVYVLVSYNRFVAQRALVEESWSQVDVELQRRHDLVPALVRTVEAYADQEAGVLERVTAARVAAQRHSTAPPEERRTYEEELGGAMHRVLGVAEAYPELRASESFLQLQHELSNTEDRIAAGRRFYNGNVRALNTRVASFPSNLVAGRFGFEAEEFFELADLRAAEPPTLGWERRELDR